LRVEGLEGRNLTPNPYTPNPKQGFTLIELLVTTSILGIIGLTILTTFASGLNVFERVEAFGGAQTDVLLALEEMEKDIKNVFPFSTIMLEGDAQSITFPAVIETYEPDDEENIISSVGTISYYIDDATYIDNVAKGLMRAVRNYSQAIAGAEAAEDQSSYLAPIEDLSFQYYYYDENLEEYGWKDSWNDTDETLLSGVKIVMTYKDGSRDVAIERAVMIPTIQKIIEIEEDEEEEEGGEEGEGEEGEGE